MFLPPIKDSRPPSPAKLSSISFPYETGYLCSLDTEATGRADSDAEIEHYCTLKHHLPKVPSTRRQPHKDKLSSQHRADTKADSMSYSGSLRLPIAAEPQVSPSTPHPLIAKY
ncbi:hypothetical protein HYFRA_00010135 [Hymenoscyphus fraxineus]|uniref:Uncharacterized protein n=1 Tax=Hymenoscyphus fraxineus TaxID=746836 RepID=A0A9N9KWQ5_9HELO|nr:hypothetical protein HYFRA_00010135 [Hymenoscyphus fraxineus]